MGVTDVAYRSAVDLAGAVASREVSPVEVMEATLRRVEEREPSLNAIVHKGFDEARTRRGRRNGLWARGSRRAPSPVCPS